MRGRNDLDDFASQRMAVLDWLRTGRSLTPLEALHRWGIFRLAARVYELRESGYDINTTLEYNEDRSKRWARYDLLSSAGAR